MPNIHRSMKCRLTLGMWVFSKQYFPTDENNLGKIKFKHYLKKKKNSNAQFNCHWHSAKYIYIYIYWKKNIVDISLIKTTMCLNLIKKPTAPN